MPLANLREIRERIEKERKAEKKQERSNTYKGEKFKGHYQGYEDPEFVLAIGHSPKTSNAYTKDGISEYYFNKEIIEKTVVELEVRGIKWGILERENGTSGLDFEFVNKNFQNVKIIELHNNTGGGDGGIEALKGKQKRDNNFGETMIQEISKTTGLRLRGLKEIENGNGAGFMNKLPNVVNSLIELGFFDNEKDLEKLRKNNNYNVMLGILNGYLVSEGKERVSELKAYDKNGKLKENIRVPKQQKEEKIRQNYVK